MSSVHYVTCRTRHHPSRVYITFKTFWLWCHSQVMTSPLRDDRHHLRNLMSPPGFDITFKVWHNLQYLMSSPGPDITFHSLELSYDVSYRVWEHLYDLTSFPGFLIAVTWGFDVTFRIWYYLQRLILPSEYDITPQILRPSGKPDVSFETWLRLQNLTSSPRLSINSKDLTSSPISDITFRPWCRLQEHTSLPERITLQALTYLQDLSL